MRAVPKHRPREDTDGMVFTRFDGALRKREAGQALIRSPLRAWGEKVSDHARGIHPAAPKRGRRR
jgi:hypothetical protein